MLKMRISHADRETTTGRRLVGRRHANPKDVWIMSQQKSPLSRRRFLATTAVGAAAAASGSLAMPSVLRAQGAGVKIGLLHPVSGALSYSGQQGRIGASMAVDEINAAGGIKALKGAKLDPVLGDAQSTPDGGTAEVEKMNAAEVSCIVGGYSSSICLAVSQAAARYDLPYAVDVGVADSIVTRGLKNTFRFGPGFGVIAKTALDNLVAINEAAGKPAKTVIIVHEDSLFGSGLAKLLNAQLPAKGFEILETIPHPTPTRDFNNVVLKIKAQNPDIVIPADYYNEYVLLARTMLEQHVRPKGIYSVLGGAASSYKFVKEFPDAAKYIMDCNHWFNPKSAKTQELKKKVEDKGQFFTYELYMNYNAVYLVADALEHAASADRAKLTEALANSTFASPIMPYGPTKFVNGNNEGAAPANTQVIDNDIKVILPAEFANAKAVFPIPA
jgi:branched-chain amino acid transport system substrate-binding protein